LEARTPGRKDAAMAISDDGDRFSREDREIARHLPYDGLSAEHHRKYCSPLWMMAREFYDREQRDRKPIPAPLPPPKYRTPGGTVISRETALRLVNQGTYGSLNELTPEY
jgi:hypothetical protein